MNGRLRNSEMVDLVRSLRALADEDRHVQAPPHVHAAVMQTWDVVRPSAQHAGHGRRGRAAILAIGSLAAALVAVVVMYRAPWEPSRTQPVAARSPEQQRVVLTPPPADRDTSAEVHRQRPRRLRTRVETMAPRHGAGMVFVADPILDASATKIVRVRVPRTALVGLGLPLVEPDDRGLVELEMLVGEDGVARTIRYAVPIAVRQE
jgi:hypothetical protein